MLSKLYSVVRQDLSPGQQAVQSAHALLEFAFEHPLARQWHQESNTLALLAVTNEAELEALARAADLRGVPVSRFREPDRNNELTAIVLGPEGRRLVQRLPLMLLDRD